MTYAFLFDTIFNNLASPRARRLANVNHRAGSSVDYWELNDPELERALKTRWNKVTASDVIMPYPTIMRIVVALTNDPEVTSKLAQHLATWRRYDRSGTYRTASAIPTLCRIAHAHLRKHGVCLTVEATVQVATAWENCIWCEMVGMGTQAEAAQKMLDNSYVNDVHFN